MAFEAIYIKKNVSLFENQKQNVKALVHRRRALLTDHVGSGKSLSCLYAFAYLKEKKCLLNMLVLTPLSAYEKQVWKADINKFTNFKTIDLDTFAKRVEGHFDKLHLLLAQYDVIYCKHSHVKQYLDLMISIAKIPTTLICCDEVHAFRNPKSQLTQRFKAMTLQSKNFWGVTGTALSKNLEDLYNIINLIYPWYLGAFTTFRDTYCIVRERVISVGGKKRKLQLIVGIKDEFLLRKKLEPIMITGESFVNVNFHYIDYQLSPMEMSIYRKVANGIDLQETMSSSDWIQYALSSNIENSRPIKDVEKYSSRFIYLQTATDGVLSSSGTQDRMNGTKVTKLVNLLKEIVLKGQSCLVYFDFLASLDIVYKSLMEEQVNARILISTGDNVLDAAELSEAKCKIKPHIVLGTRASAESASYYFINNVIFFHVPTVPHTFIQFVGRITRKNTLYPDDLNCYIFRSDGIDLYKLMVVSSKTKQLEVVNGCTESNVPSDYKEIVSKGDMLEKMKRHLLWRK